MSTAYLGLGSNLGDRKLNIETALEKLNARRNIEVKEISSIVETNAVGDPTQPKFLNACCRIETLFYPDELLGALKSIETEMGRTKGSAVRTSVEEQLKMLQEGRLDFNAIKDSSPEKKRHQDAWTSKWGPRTIDIDILFYDDIVMKGNNLVIPHPRLHKRIFVLRPLSEIAQDFIHPILKKSIKDLLFEYRPE